MIRHSGNQGDPLSALTPDLDGLHDVERRTQQPYVKPRKICVGIACRNKKTLEERSMDASKKMNDRNTTIAYLKSDKLDLRTKQIDCSPKLLKSAEVRLLLTL